MCVYNGNSYYMSSPVDTRMCLKDYQWDGYYPGYVDILEEFFIPALKHSSQYDRITGSFSSSVLELFSEGLPEFIENGGTIRLLPGVVLYEKDIEAIRKGYTDEVLSERINWEKIAEGNCQDVVEALAWLVAEDILQIKIGVVTDDLGRLQTQQEAEWHQKIAIFKDKGNNAIGITGSPNESFKALQENRESLTLFRDWIESEENEWDEKTRLDKQIEEFEQLWNDEDSRSVVFDFPEALRKNLIEKAPESEPDWNRIIYNQNSEVSGRKDIELRPYQKEVIERFLDNGNRLILDHATGTGKTWSSLLMIQHAVEDSDIIVIFAPTKDLVDQWIDDDNISRFFPKSSIVRCLGDANWRERLQNYLFTERSAPLFVVSTMHPTTMEDVIERVNSANKSRVAVIADEVHNLGSSLRRTIFPSLEADSARVALSATPFRDDPGDEAITEYFGDTIHEISIKDAIEKYGVLSEYEYHIHPVVLSDSERNRFRDHSTEISNLYNTYKSYEGQSLIEVSDRNPDLKVEVMNRARIVKECSAKLDVTRSLIDKAGTRTLVYCNTEEHTEQVVGEVDDHTIKTVSIFLGRLPSSEKENLLTHFEGGKIDVLVSIDCLTEGIDVPNCDSAILVTSSTTERETVQRRGRILREGETDEPAHLYDFVTLPADLKKIKAGEADLVPAEISLIERELQRLDIMNADAANKIENDPRILRLTRAITQYDPK